MGKAVPKMNKGLDQNLLLLHEMMPISPQSYFKESFVRFPTCCEHCNMGKVVNDDLKMTMGGAMAALYGFRSFKNYSR